VRDPFYLESHLVIEVGDLRFWVESAVVGIGNLLVEVKSVGFEIADLHFEVAD
jgi:hypothetical protein